jgi:hypothetical protein
MMNKKYDEDIGKGLRVRDTNTTMKSIERNEVHIALVMMNYNIFWDIRPTLLFAGFFLVLFFHPEDEGDVFLRNVA